MTNYKFRFPPLILCKWFHKLKNMNQPRRNKHLPTSYSLNTTKKKNSSSQSNSLPHSSSSYFSNTLHTSLESRTLQISPRKMQSKRKCVYKPSPPSSSFVSAGFNKNKIKVPPTQDSSSASSYLKLNSSANDIIIDMKSRYSKKMIVKDSKEKACPASNRTKEILKLHHLSVKANNTEKLGEEDACRIQKKLEKTSVSSGRRSSANSPRIKLRVSSPRVQVWPRRSKLRSQSFAVIKSSVDPKKDFRESMVEMIKENNIKASKDLEDLLAGYLSLNHKEYHDLIIKVFLQVWLEVINSTFASK